MDLPALAHRGEVGPDLLAAFHRLGRIVLGGRPLAGTLAEVARMAKTLTARAEVSITLVRAGAAVTAASTAQVAVDLDERQHEQGHGPCLHAAAADDAVAVRDTGADGRWPVFADEALRAGVRSSLSIPLQARGQAVGSMNLYAAAVDAFGGREVELARAFASYAVIALENARSLDASRALAGQLRAAIESRAAIEQAKGILMGQRRIDAEQAFDILRGISRHSNSKLRDVAQALVDTAPSTGGEAANLRGDSAGGTVTAAGYW